MALNKAQHDAICRKLIDRGRLIEAGFETLRFMSIAEDAPPLQVEEMRMAFFAGAQHTLASILSMLEPGAEATEKDFQRLRAIGAELDEFIEQFRASRNIPGTIH